MSGGCQGCGAELSDDVRFCPSCGTPRAVLACPSCGAPSSGDRFCGQCGAPSPAAPGNAQAPLPRRVAERRVTSVLFGDLVGFTTLSESRDSEEVRELLSEYFAQARTVVARYGGVIEKFIGDAVMAVWGVPVAHEDDAERAVRAGLDLVEAVALLGEQVGAPGLAMRVGVVTGEVAVTLGATAEGMVAGDAVNTAARVQAAAQPGTVWVDESTRTLTSAAVDYADAGEHSLKGKAQPARLFHAKTVIAAVGGAQRIDGLEAPFTGRDRQLRLIKELCHETAEEGRPRLVLVTGAAGIGKSRLAWEFEKYVDGLSSTFAWHRGRCLSYGEGVAFWALAEVVRARLGLTDADPPSVVSERLDARLPELLPDTGERAWVQPRLEVLLGTGDGRVFASEDLYAGWTRFLERAGAGDPVIVVLDDLQHADDALLEFLEHLLATGSSAVHVLALARPELLERRPSLASHRRVSVLHLEPLGTAAMATLVDGLVEGLTGQTRDALVARAEGIPLFAVETVRALIDRDLVIASEGRYVLASGAEVSQVRELAAPASLHALVASRLDALPDAERHVLSTASILGLSFPLGALAALNPDADDLDETVAALVRRELLTVQSDRFSADHGQLRFVQAVVRQVAYETLSRRDRRAGHLAAAAHLQAEQNAEELSALIAQHLIDAVDAGSAGDPDTEELTARAVTLLESAAARATSLAAFAEAHRHYLVALTCATDDDTRLRLREGAAASAVFNNDYDAALEQTAAVLDALAALPERDPIREARVAFVAATAYEYSGRAGEVELLLPYLERLPDTPESRPVMLDVLTRIVGALSVRGENDAARPLRERQLALAEQLGDPIKLMHAWSAIAINHTTSGHPATGAALQRACVELARAEQDPASLSRALTNLYTAECNRDLDSALSYAREAYAVSSRTSVYARHVAGVNLCMVLHQSGSWGECGEVLDKLLEPMAKLDPTLVAAKAVQLWQEEARHGRVTLDAVPDWEDLDDKNSLAWSRHLAMVVARRVGDLKEAAREGAASVDMILEGYGMEDEFPPLWTHAVLASLDAGLLAQVEQQISLVADAPPGLVSPALAAELPRLQGLLALARGEDPEPQLRAAITSLEAFGLVPDRA
ncbi:MAG TPA: adenylate/guanylate cyclase domain-containing protein, partial [Mycobacteriales bacterium]|nr:adenylate/guanylate cyclase domain-containing protein [Mycobacteriales bacterium]